MLIWARSSLLCQAQFCPLAAVRSYIFPCKLTVKLKWVVQFFPSMSGIAKAEGDEARKAAIELVDESLVLLEDAFVKCSKGQSFFGGHKIGYLDIAFGSFLAWLRVTEKMNHVSLLDETKTPGLSKWADDFCSDAAVKDVMPETDKLADVAKMLFAKFKSPPSN